MSRKLISELHFDVQQTDDLTNIFLIEEANALGVSEASNSPSQIGPWGDRGESMNLSPNLFGFVCLFVPLLGCLARCEVEKFSRQSYMRRIDPFLKRGLCEINKGKELLLLHRCNLIYCVCWLLRSDFTLCSQNKKKNKTTPSGGFSLGDKTNFLFSSVTN